MKIRSVLDKISHSDVYHGYTHYKVHDIREMELSESKEGLIEEKAIDHFLEFLGDQIGMMRKGDKLLITVE